VFTELIGAILWAGRLGLGHPHVVGFALAALAVLMQWMRREPERQAGSS
jgi:hypothetical protein